MGIDMKDKTRIYRCRSEQNIKTIIKCLSESLGNLIAHCEQNLGIERHVV